MFGDEFKPQTTLHARVIKLSLPLSFLGLTALSSLTVACEEEQQNVSSRRAVVQPKRVVSDVPNAVDTSKYTLAGNGPMKAPDWISSQDFSLMRRYSLNAPTGFRNGNEFTPKGIWIDRREAGWVLVLNEEALSFPTETLMRGERVEIPLTGDLSAQYRTQVEVSSSDASWRIPSSNIPGTTALWENQSEYMLELLQWSIKPYRSGGDVFQIAGEASGRLMARFTDEKGVQAWVVGKFERVPVRYMGDPNRW